MSEIKVDTGSICILLFLLFMAGCNTCNTMQDIHKELQIIANKK